MQHEWSFHPANPICSDVRWVRNAGQIFWRDGMRIRPAQEGSRGYGHAISFQQIVALSPSQYEELPICRVEPDFMLGLLGTHTYNTCHKLEAIDGKFLARD